MKLANLLWKPGWAAKEGIGRGPMEGHINGCPSHKPLTLIPATSLCELSDRAESHDRVGSPRVGGWNRAAADDRAQKRRSGRYASTNDGEGVTQQSVTSNHCTKQGLQQAASEEVGVGGDGGRNGGVLEALNQAIAPVKGAVDVLRQRRRKVRLNLKCLESAGSESGEEDRAALCQRLSKLDAGVAVATQELAGLEKLRLETVLTEGRQTSRGNTCEEKPPSAAHGGGAVSLSNDVVRSQVGVSQVRGREGKVDTLKSRATVESMRNMTARQQLQFLVNTVERGKTAELHLVSENLWRLHSHVDQPSQLKVLEDEEVMLVLKCALSELHIEKLASICKILTVLARAPGNKRALLHMGVVGIITSRLRKVSARVKSNRGQSPSWDEREQVSAALIALCELLWR